jgi:hypothetical protein
VRLYLRRRLHRRLRVVAGPRRRTRAGPRSRRRATATWRAEECMSTQHVRGPRVYVCKKTNLTKEYLKGTDLQEGTDCWLPESQHAPATPCLIGPHIASFAYAAIRGCLVPLHLATAASRDPNTYSRAYINSDLRRSFECCSAALGGWYGRLAAIVCPSFKALRPSRPWLTDVMSCKPCDCLV